MSISRREFLQMLAVAAAQGMPLAGHPAQTQRADALYDLRGVRGNVTLLHLTDCHAQLLPVYFREPDVNIGVHAAWGKPPHLVGEALLKQFKIPIPCEDDDTIVGLFEENITPRTKLILMSHIINITGQILPVKRVAAMARARGIPVIVDGAHGLAHFDFKIPDLDCDFYGVSLHKWLFAPHGCGLLYVRRDRIKSLWPLMAAKEEQIDDIRKFEEIGTHPAANHNAIAEALAFHEGIGGERKAARLRFLRDRWMNRLEGQRGVKLFTSKDPQMSCGLATFGIDDLDPNKVVEHLWKQRRILVTPIVHAEFKGIRVTPNVYTTLKEIDTFAENVEAIIRDGLPNA